MVSRVDIVTVHTLTERNDFIKWGGRKRKMQNEFHVAATTYILLTIEIDE